MNNQEVSKLNDKIRSQQLTIGSLIRTLKDLEKATLTIHEFNDANHDVENCKVCEALGLARVMFLLEKHTMEELGIS